MTSWKRFERKDTSSLISIFQAEGEDPINKDDAFLTLCFRFRRDLLNKCEIICRKLGHDIDVASEIAETTLKQYGKSRNFDHEKGTQTNIDDNFRVYLYKIASNELKKFYKNEIKKRNGQLYDGSEEIVTDFPQIDVSKLSPKERFIHERFTSLPLSHQIIYMTYKLHAKDGVNLPRKLQEKLRSHLGGISQSTVRTYKKEATDRLEEAKQIVNHFKDSI